MALAVFTIALAMIVQAAAGPAARPQMTAVSVTNDTSRVPPGNIFRGVPQRLGAFVIETSPLSAHVDMLVLSYAGTGSIANARIVNELGHEVSGPVSSREGKLIFSYPFDVPAGTHWFVITGELVLGTWQGGETLQLEGDPAYWQMHDLIGPPARVTSAHLELSAMRVLARVAPADMPRTTLYISAGPARGTFRLNWHSNAKKCWPVAGQAECWDGDKEPNGSEVLYGVEKPTKFRLACGDGFRGPIDVAEVQYTPADKRLHQD